MQLHYHMYYSYARGCTEDFSKKKIFSNTFFSLCKLVDMVYRMKSHQGRFQKKSFSCVLCEFSRVFFLFCWEKCVFGWFSFCFHCCSATCVAFRPPLFYRLIRALIMYILLTLLNEVNLVSMHHLSSTRPSPSDSISTFSAHVLLPLDHHVANKSRSTLS